MQNELLLIATLLIEYSAVVLAHHFFGKNGLIAWMAIATVLANIEVMILVDAFGIEMTLGNVLFASTFLVTDILSELYGRKVAKQAVVIGIASSIIYAVVSCSWLLYRTSTNDVTSSFIHGLFSHAPRIVAASIIVYAIVQLLDIVLYHRFWAVTTGGEDSSKGLWIRNNAATIISQCINAVLYNLIAFVGIYPAATIKEIIISNVLIYIVTSLADTPFVYLARKDGRRCEDI